MKKLFKLTTLALVIVLSLFAVGCSSYGKLEKAFLDNGYEIVTELDESTNDIKAELEAEGLVVTIHGFKKTGILGGDFVTVIEFNATEDLVKAYTESDTVKGFVSDVQNDENVQTIYNTLVDLGFAKGNCLVLSTNPLNMLSVCQIVKNA